MTGCGCHDEESRTVLCADHWQALLVELEKPAEPNQALREAAERYRARRAL